MSIYDIKKKTFQETQETVLRLVRTADQLLRRSKLDVEGVRQRLQTVDTECENFMIRLDTRRKNITMATSFFEQTESVSFKTFSSFNNECVVFCTHLAS